MHGEGLDSEEFWPRRSQVSVLGHGDLCRQNLRELREAFNRKGRGKDEPVSMMVEPGFVATDLFQAHRMLSRNQGDDAIEHEERGTMRQDSEEVLEIEREHASPKSKSAGNRGRGPALCSLRLALVRSGVGFVQRLWFLPAALCAPTQLPRRDSKSYLNDL